MVDSRLWLAGWTGPIEDEVRRENPEVGMNCDVI